MSLPDLLQARQFGEEAFRVSEAVGDVWCMAANALILLGAIAVDLGDYGQAVRQFEQGLRWYTELEFGGYPWAVAFACVRLGEMALLTRDYEKAKRWLQQSLDYFEKAGRGADRTYCEALYDVSKLYAAQGTKEDAVELLFRLSLAHYDTGDQDVRDLAIASLAELQAALPEAIYAAAVERGKLLDLETVVADFLAT